MLKNPLVSVIVPTKNSSSTLEACLESIQNQTYKSIELIVVDNFSRDTTQIIARKYTNKVFNSGPERSAQRNFGAEQSKGEYVVFIDSDMELSKKVIEDCVHVISENQNIKGIIIPEESFGEGFWAQCKKLERSFYVGVPWMEAARFFEKNIFNEIQGYNEDLISGEDWDLSQRVSRVGSIGRAKELVYHNEGRLNFFQSVKKKYSYAKLFKYYQAENKSEPNFGKQTSLVQRYILFFSRPKEILMHPILFIGMLLLKTAEFLAGGYAYFFSELKKIKASNELSPTLEELPFVSFILPTYNAEEYLERCLDAIFAQDYPADKFEVIVADGFSSDRTLSILLKYKVIVLDNPEVNSDFGKYLALKKAKGDLVAFIDSDNIIVGTDWLKKMVLPFQLHPDLMAAESNYLIAPDFSSINVYATMLVIVDPLARMLASKPEKVYMSEHGFQIKHYARGSAPVAGANGFLWRMSMVKPHLNDQTRRFAETNLLVELARQTEITIANTPGVGVYHYYVTTLSDYVQKRKKIAKKFLGRKEQKEATWLDKRDTKIVLSSLYLLSVLGPLVEGTLNGIRYRRVEWFWHPIISPLTVLIYTNAYIFHAK